jgi:general secretion pathway protein C
MGKTRKSAHSAGGWDLRARALGAVRPGVEALLLAAVALGCAQAGWTVLTPSSAGALSTSTDDEAETTRLLVSDVVSPFAPEPGEAGTNAAAAVLTGVQLNGVRVSTDAARSGAVLTMNDGVQRAFAVGQEISAGVTLSEVGADYVLVSYQGGRQEISMNQAPSFSFARALMGQQQASEAAAQPEATAPVAAAAPVTNATFATARTAPAGPSASETAWLQATLGQFEAGRGWRVAEPLPQAALDAGLRGGDVIVAINGARAGDPSALLAAAQSGRLELGVSRGDQQLTLSIQTHERT